jgi:cob(I)alamin adenosyltransferase
VGKLERIFRAVGRVPHASFGGQWEAEPKPQPVPDPEPDQPRFQRPRVALNRIYTKTGDQGQTHLAGGQRVSKDSARIECYGTVDELNAFVGMAAISAANLDNASVQALALILRRVQHELFNLGSILATKPEDVHPKQARVTEAEVRQLEIEIDRMNEDLEPLRSFVLPGGTRLNTELHACRTICRRAERLAVTLARDEAIPQETIQYLNRLSDAFFVWSRWVNHVLGVPEVLWDPNRAASGTS